jgi:hypothetical protein
MEQFDPIAFRDPQDRGRRQEGLQHPQLERLYGYLSSCVFYL